MHRAVAVSILALLGALPAAPVLAQEVAAASAEARHTYTAAQFFETTSYGMSAAV